jgi:hypothetical protein
VDKPSGPLWRRILRTVWAVVRRAGTVVSYLLVEGSGRPMRQRPDENGRKRDEYRP